MPALYKYFPSDTITPLGPSVTATIPGVNLSNFLKTSFGLRKEMPTNSDASSAFSTKKERCFKESRISFRRWWMWCPLGLNATRMPCSLENLKSGFNRESDSPARERYHHLLFNWRHGTSLIVSVSEAPWYPRIVRSPFWSSSTE